MRNLFLLFCSVMSAQAIVMIKPLDVGENALGVSGSITTSYSINKGNTDLSAMDIGGMLQLDTNQSVSFLQGNYRRGDAEEKLTIHQGFMHGRYIYQFHPIIDGEVFIQEQFNEFVKLISRTLMGSGGRVNIGEATSFGKGYLGLGAFYAIELEEGDVLNYFSRANIYLSYKYTHGKEVTLAIVSYYQPRIDELSDYLILSKAQMEVKISQRLALIFSFNMNYDSKPAAGVKEYDIAQRTALKFSF